MYIKCGGSHYYCCAQNENLLFSLFVTAMYLTFYEFSDMLYFSDNKNILLSFESSILRYIIVLLIIINWYGFFHLPYTILLNWIGQNLQINLCLHSFYILYITPSNITLFQLPVVLFEIFLQWLQILIVIPKCSRFMHIQFNVGWWQAIQSAYLPDWHKMRMQQRNKLTYFTR